jgi:plastocyanin
LQHDFKIAGKKTPRVAAGKRATLKGPSGKPGRYPYLCTVTEHAAGGMKGTLVVK